MPHDMRYAHMGDPRGCPPNCPFAKWYYGEHMRELVPVPSPVDRCETCGVVRRSHDGVSTHEFNQPRTLSPNPTDAAWTFLRAAGLEPTPDAVAQLIEAFLPALAKMCDEDHPWDPEGATWQQAGRLGALADCRKKFMRLWERAWINGSTHDDSALDLLNYTGFFLRANHKRWGDWGEPGRPDADRS